MSTTARNSDEMDDDGLVKIHARPAREPEPATSHVPISDSGERTIAQALEIVPDASVGDVYSQYEIDRVVKFITENGYAKVLLKST